MIRKYLFFIAILVSTAVDAQQKITTFIIVRHAEKGNDGTNDPDLADAGKARAQALSALLKKTKIDAIYSTPYKRTRNTVAPLAQDKGITVMEYNTKPDGYDAMIEKFKGGTIVVCGHSNTSPALVNYLTGHKDEYKMYDDADYGNIVIVSVVEKGSNATVTWLNY